MKNVKKLKRLVALALSVVMVLAMSVFAFADTTVKTCTITGPGNGHTYKIYQIFTGEYDKTRDVLSNVKWGRNGTDTVGKSVSEDILNALTGVNGKTDEKKLTVIKPYVNLNSTAAFEINATTNSVKVPDGYYLIQDTALANQDPVPDAYSTDIVKVVKNLTIVPKSAVPSFEKKIKDRNDTKDDAKTYTDWQDSADYDIGDNVPFKLEGTVASNYDAYKHYYFAFHDVEENGLSFNKDVKVYVDKNPIKSGYEVKTTGITDGCTFEVEFDDLKKIDGVKAGSKITVEYTSKLNANAVLGNKGNVNEAKLVFSNNPKNEQVGKPKTPGETPWDNVIVFTYKVVVNKVDENDQPLTGAEFTLKKNIKDKDDKVTRQEPVAVVKNTAGTTFTFGGLDDGEYILEETTTPGGYNTISPITFTVDAGHNITWEGANRNTILESLTGNKVSGEITLTSDKTAGSLTTDVVNKKGSTLPSTGGIGTTIFYVVGAILMVGAAVLLITKRRAEN